MSNFAMGAEGLVYIFTIVMGKKDFVRDAGAPLICLEDDRLVLRGVLSWGKCNNEGEPSVYANVFNEKSWIQESDKLIFNVVNLQTLDN